MRIPSLIPPPRTGWHAASDGRSPGASFSSSPAPSSSGSTGPSASAPSSSAPAPWSDGVVLVLLAPLALPVALSLAAFATWSDAHDCADLSAG